MRLFLYIVLMTILVIVMYLENKRNKLDYKNNPFKSKVIIPEGLIIILISACFGKNYFSFSLYLIGVLAIYIQYLTTNIKSLPEEERVKETTLYFVKAFILVFFLDIPVFFISNLKILGFTFFSFVFIMSLICIDTMYGINKREKYKLLTNEEISKLFPGYDMNNLYRALYNTVHDVKVGYMNNKTDDYKSNLSDDLYNLYKQKEKDNIAKSQKEVFESIAFVSSGLIDFNDGIFKVELVYSFKNYIIDITSGRVLNGTPQFPKRCTFVYEFKYTDKVILLSEKLVNSI